MPELAETTIDLDTLTLGEIIAAEDASGLTIEKLLTRLTYRMLVAVFVQRLRSSGQPPSWHELEALRLHDVSSGLSRSRADSRSERSNGSE
jgi:hypothetical protein